MIYLGADHRGFKLKEQIKQWLDEEKIRYEDMGNKKFEATDDFPDYGQKVAEKVSQGKGKGILMCGSAGMAMVANKFKGVRAVECWNQATAEHAKAHDNANVLMLPADFVNLKDSQKMIKVWLKTKTLIDSKHQRRLNKIKKIEDNNFKLKEKI